MGYTNYWKCEKDLPQEAFSSAVMDCQKAFEVTDVKLAGSSGRGNPDFTNYQIVFNGSGSLICEDFMFSKNQEPRNGRSKASGFCKTEKLPYDLCVKIALIILKHHLGKLLSASSDGEDSDWDEARDICQKTLGYGQGFVKTTL